MNPAQFRIFYNQTIHPELVRLDRKRRKMLWRIAISVVLMTGLMALLYLIGIFVLALLAAIPFVIYISYLAAQVQKFKQTFKPQVVKLVLDFIDDGALFGDLTYKPKGMVSKEKFYRSAIFGVMPSVYRGEDLIEGRIGDVEFEMSEIDAEVFSRVRNRMVDVFRGVLLRAKFFYPLHGTLLVVPRSALPDISQAVKSFIGHGGQVMDAFVKHKKFSQVYAVYGSKNTKVQELLPRHLLDFLLHHTEEYGDIYLSIFKENCYVAITSEKDILEPKIFQSNVSFELVREFFDDIYVALHVVSELDRAH